jgi:thioredoxin reductase (NADPH)
MNIILYTKTGCPWCKGVIDLFKEKNVKYEEREVLGNKAYFDELVAKSGQTKTPTLDIDGEILADSDKDQVTVYMKNKGVAGF